MLTEVQEKYLLKIPEDAMTNIKPWDSHAAEFAKNLVQEIKQDSGLEVFWGGSLALSILGENDIDLCIFAEPEDFDTSLPKVSLILGEPTYKLSEKILWRITKDGYKIDASLLSKNSTGVLLDTFFSQSLKDNPSLLQEYIALKVPGLSAREYYRKKNEFYNRVTGNK